MNKLFIVLFLSCSITAFSQRPSDLTFHLSTYDEQKITLEYRIPIKDKWNLNFGLSYGSSYNNYTSFYDANDSISIDRHTNYTTSISNFRIGTDKRIKESMFSVGFDFLIGYRNQEIHKNNTELTLDSTGNWSGFLNYHYGMDDPTHAQITKHYVVPGLQLNLKMDVPIKNNFEFALSVGYNVNTPLLVKETNIIDPFNELSHPNFHVINALPYASIGLRYKFIKKTKV